MSRSLSHEDASFRYVCVDRSTHGSQKTNKGPCVIFKNKEIKHRWLREESGIMEQEVLNGVGNEREKWNTGRDN